MAQYRRVIRHRVIWPLAAATCAILSLPALASPLVYRPVNPAFGGNPLNSTYLYQGAEIQNEHRESSSSSSLSATQRLSQTITSSLLNRIAAQISESILGENAQDSGTFNLGDATIDFVRGDGTVTVNITDLITGETTSVSIPEPTF